MIKTIKNLFTESRLLAITSGMQNVTKKETHCTLLVNY